MKKIPLIFVFLLLMSSAFATMTLEAGTIYQSETGINYIIYRDMTLNTGVEINGSCVYFDGEAVCKSSGEWSVYYNDAGNLQVFQDKTPQKQEHQAGQNIIDGLGIFIVFISVIIVTMIGGYLVKVIKGQSTDIKELEELAIFAFNIGFLAVIGIIIISAFINN